jgi:hypothetical protein
MGKKLIWIMFLLLSIATLPELYAQFENNPPEPMASSHSSTGDCGEGDGGKPGGISPPVGLCLPINDYLIPLLMAGIALGAYRISKLEQMNQNS